MKAGKSTESVDLNGVLSDAAMEPGHEGREERLVIEMAMLGVDMPQWSPAMKAGKSAAHRVPR